MSYLGRLSVWLGYPKNERWDDVTWAKSSLFTSQAKTEVQWLVRRKYSK